MPRRKKPEPKPASLWELPQLPAVYALCGGSERRRYVAYVGIARKLRRRIGQHLITRDSGVAVGTSAVGINAADYVTEVCWWQSGSFRGKYALEAAEMVATEILQPALDSRAMIPEATKRKLDDAAFRERMEALFTGEPTGRVPVPSVASLEARVRAVEKKLDSVLENMADSHS